MFHRKAPKFDISDHPDILAALARMEQEAYARGRADALAIAEDYLEEWEHVQGLESAAMRRMIARLEA